jgi:16S rRNA (guanine527-N7)-methyltransferase
MVILHTDESQWSAFAQTEHLSDLQLSQFKRYYELLIAWNEKINLTAITALADVIAYHFQDSLQLAQAVPLAQVRSIADVGSGAGFPGLPLKIAFPHLSLLIIEVNSKRVRFVQEVIRELGLQGIEISTLDWRTFLRQTKYPVDYFCARASLSVAELLQVYKPSCWYRQAGLVYWASGGWVPTEREKKSIKEEHLYMVGTKKRKLVVFSCIECII